jgi:DNA-binding SARP family transcriptional activator
MRLAVDGNLSLFADNVLKMADEHRRLGMRRYAGISLLNAAGALKAQGAAEQALSHATDAIELLTGNAPTHEVTAAHVYRAWALAHLARSQEASAESEAVLAALDPTARPEAMTELAAIHLWYADIGAATRLLDASRSSIDERPEFRNFWRAAAMEIALVDRDLARAHKLSFDLDSDFYLEMGFRARCLVLKAHLAVLEAQPNAHAMVVSAIELADRQDAFFWSRYARLLAAAVGPPQEFAARAATAIDDQSVYLSILADLIVDRLCDCDDALLGRVSAETHLRPGRWLTPLRRIIDVGTGPAKWLAARLLDEIGEQEDVARLRALAKSAKGRAGDRGVGRGLSRRLAPRVFIEDQGRVAISVGERLVQGGEVRRKVLALLCFLLSRHGLSATRDQVLDALWPELDPTVALNSLNQTVYFLRRVFEPQFTEELSPGYLQHDSNLLWLDDELVSARSASCWELIRLASSGGSPLATDRLASTYVAKFALDFAYEEWAIAYRDSLHAAYLQILETAVTKETAAGAFDRAIDLARSALTADPDAEQIEVSLLRLYRVSGAHSAAAEQYSHYADAIRREIGVEPPPIEMV